MLNSGSKALSQLSKNVKSLSLQLSMVDASALVSIWLLPVISAIVARMHSSISRQAKSWSYAHKWKLLSSRQEVDVGLAADVGTLQRLPKAVGNQSLVRELAFTSRK